MLEAARRLVAPIPSRHLHSAKRTIMRSQMKSHQTLKFRTESVMALKGSDKDKHQIVADMSTIVAQQATSRSIELVMGPSLSLRHRIKSTPSQPICLKQAVTRVSLIHLQMLSAAKVSAQVSIYNMLRAMTIVKRHSKSHKIRCSLRQMRLFLITMRTPTVLTNISVSN